MDLEDGGGAACGDDVGGADVLDGGGVGEVAELRVGRVEQVEAGGGGAGGVVEAATDDEAGRLGVTGEDVGAGVVGACAEVAEAEVPADRDRALDLVLAEAGVLLDEDDEAVGRVAVDVGGVDRAHRVDDRARLGERRADLRRGDARGEREHETGCGDRGWATSRPSDGSVHGIP